MANANNVVKSGFVKSSLDVVLTGATIGATYVALEVINHTLLFGYMQAWLVGLGLSATVISVILWSLFVVFIGFIGFLAWKFYVSKRNVQ